MDTLIFNIVFWIIIIKRVSRWSELVPVVFDCVVNIPAYVSSSTDDEIGWLRDGYSNF